MLGLVIRDPWLSKIIRGEKTWELRSQNTNIRGRIGLIKGGSKKIFGTAKLVNCVLLTKKEAYRHYDKHRVPKPDLFEFMMGKRAIYAWVLSDVKVFEEPIPYVHNSGAVIWVRIPDVEAI
jgi:ASCH domain-containing protein